ncbi:MAG: glycosyl hydrolase repeat-containing protein [Flaviaesturariibacter sp.]|nr:glycosyl hydrolase repeat-containing protein [Flaviaesturariibacter sp.]
MRCSFPKPLLACLVFLFPMVLLAQVDTTLLGGLRWRMIGPHRGGRTVGAVGVPQQPNVFYIGVNNGGVWKTTDYGRTWFPIFDEQSTGSVGDVVVAPSNPNVLYVGSGEGLQRPDLSVGNGMYKSVDAGKTWTHLGLREGQQIGGLAIDPTNENRVFAAVLGHPYGPNKERGVYRTTDGGKTWQQVLYKDENTGAVQVTIDPQNPAIVYADLWAGRQGPWENGAWNGPESGLFKSTDGGNTWKKLTAGLPTTKQGLGRIGFCIAPSNPNRLYATVDAAPQYGGIYRSDDAGESWTKLSGDNRFYGRAADFAEVKVDPKNADIVYSANVVTWKSIDGGKTWNAFRGAPGGDDYHRIWINPNDPNIILIASDQGVIITVNGGETFSSWYNQPTAQFYHVSTDNAFPYNVYGGQQESGSVGIASRGADGQITYREWHPVGVEEYGYIAPDPLNPNIIYGGKITRFDKRTGQVQNIAPEVGRSGKYRFLRTAPVLFSPADNKTLFYAGNVLFKTTNGGNSWQIISPDLSRESWDIPASIGIYTTEDLKKMPRRGVIYTVAPSPKDINTIWCGTDDGLVHLTKDGGKTWKNVTPQAITSWSKVSLMEASHFDVATAYAAVNRIRLDDMKPHIYKTNDGGKTWKEIVSGLPDDPINVVREDPERRGLLYAGSETAVYVSFDDGAHWQSLRQNMPATSIRDLVVKDNDLVIGTHGRSFWILDDISPLRQQTTATAKTVLYKPAPAYRVRWSMYTDTPVPQEEPAGENPPDGAIINYYIPAAATGDATLEILDATKKVVRRYASTDQPYALPELNIPHYWIRPQQILSTGPGAHRFVWDLRYQPLSLPPTYPIGAVYKNTAPDPTSPMVMPGTYLVRLTVNGQRYEQPLVIKADPRVKTSPIVLAQIKDLALKAYIARKELMMLSAETNKLRQQLKDRQQKTTGNLGEVIKTFDQQVALFENTPQSDPAPSFNKLESLAVTAFNILDDNDMPPTIQTIAAVQKLEADLSLLTAKWKAFKIKELSAINNRLRQSGVAEIGLQ